MLLRFEPVRASLLWVFVAQFLKAELAGIGNVACRAERMRPAPEQPRHFGRAFEVPFGIGLEQVPGGGDGGLVPDRGHHIVQRAAVRGMVQHIVSGEDRQAMRARQFIQPRNPRQIARRIEIARSDMAQRGKLLDQMRQQLGERGGQKSGFARRRGRAER